MYSFIELTHPQFVRDLSGAAEKDTLINCCHVLRPTISSFSGDICGDRDIAFSTFCEMSLSPIRAAQFLQNIKLRNFISRFSFFPYRKLNSMDYSTKRDTFSYQLDFFPIIFRSFYDNSVTNTILVILQKVTE